MRYTEARQILAEAAMELGLLNEASNLRRAISRFRHRDASLIQRMGGNPEEVRQGITLKRNPHAKSGRKLLKKALDNAEKKRSDNQPNYPYGNKSDY